LLGDLFPPAQRSTANGVLNLMGGLGAMVAFLAGGMLYRLDRLSPFAFGGLVIVASILLVLLWLREPEVPRDAEKKAAGAVLMTNPFKILRAGGRSGPLILLAVIGWYLGFGTIETWISSFGVFSLGIEPDRMSLITSSFVLSFVVFSVPGGLMGTRWGRKPTILVGIVALTASFAFGWLVQDEVMLIGLLVLGGMAWALINVNALPLLYGWGGGGPHRRVHRPLLFGHQLRLCDRAPARRFPDRSERQELPGDVLVRRLLCGAGWSADGLGQGDLVSTGSDSVPLGL
jgi:maltose/moltooligosaccharide transporter